MVETTAQESKTGLPDGWTVKYSKSKKRAYFLYTEASGEHRSQWDAPEGTDREALEAYLRDHPVRVHCWHILVKHAGSRRPASHRSAKITLSKEDALKEIEQLQARLQGEAEAESDADPEKKRDKDSFGSIAQERSDCSSYKRRGDLGWFGRGEMQPSFERAAFALAPGQISGIVETDSGWHLIKRVA
ncbi:peptidylprolyl isomerase ESS1 KNAG_0M01310 [Huiozyma naganishii CBS 8797]|uniref:Peptidyl-prolyl cis-trans isomerase n=1 Tax=Huiozyma naganishii (strain ATCC MYA-139 / BCRC 22969 / CBS 8797 / KCTC 17520 / NBRC 10181 / NCYC 3082 / Yp74L-3) TaxID=1071383 RepID=J7SAS6_HUIN7|nr:hypothetical protein KNAG_0M01310 [Kazachstania naganishii CBS 8797]CCK72984.1 hypothetical protein KNAG_0M01310 [Kazachstania naganishii CBS 8797]